MPTITGVTGEIEEQKKPPMRWLFLFVSFLLGEFYSTINGCAYTLLLATTRKVYIPASSAVMSMA